MPLPAPEELLQEIRAWAGELGFDALGVSDPDLKAHEAHLSRWLKAGHHGEMEYMERHGLRRARPQELVPGTRRIISVRMNYLPPDGRPPHEVLQAPRLGYVSRYALGRDYHKLMRKRLQQLARRIEQRVGPFGYRAFVDSAPVLEKALAERAGLGWIGKHTNLIARDAGSWFFLGELFTDLPLPVSPQRESDHCGRCTACIDICPTRAILGPHKLDARRCISYLTIELRGPIPEALRPMIGNRIYGCDDCQLVCPWNRFARRAALPDFSTRNGLDAPDLIELFGWSETDFLQRMEGSPIRRIGYAAWLRNIAVALGNAPADAEIIRVLEDRLPKVDAMVAEHVRWALRQQQEKARSSR
ncbi:MAG: tRNA epoxyqueuosine(34) reductase QueG [Gammaproteobacteria bacterium]|nr:MAG: tRNA epoxyqueuosine(34) reductase QueG [Gammaproteobacteria bacterium]